MDLKSIELLIRTSQRITDGCLHTKAKDTGTHHTFARIVSFAQTFCASSIDICSSVAQNNRTYTQLFFYEQTRFFLCFKIIFRNRNTEIKKA